MKVLITGACGVTSRAVARSLRLSKKFNSLNILGIDIVENPYGLYEGLFDKIYRSPRVTAAGYEEWLRQLIDNEKPDAAILIPELEVLFWSKRGFPVPAILPPPEFCQIAISKRRLYEAIAQTGFVPSFSIVNRESIIQRNLSGNDKWPLWLRDFSEGATSGKGAFLAKSIEEAYVWAKLNPDIQQFMLAEYLPGRNFACHLLYNEGRLKRIACYERLEYFMARTVISGISGNISKGRLVNDQRLVDVSTQAIDLLVKQTGEVMQGIVAVDLKEDGDGKPRITEINLRHVAATSSFALAGFNLAESHLLQTLSLPDYGPIEAVFPVNNMIFRDIDGTPVWRADYQPLEIGEFVEAEFF